MSKTSPSILVRDLPVRIFHWSLVAAVMVAALTGFFGEENLLWLHVWAGYAVAALVVFRLLWWILGGRYSRLSAYPLSPRKVMAHIRGLLAGRSPHTPGHNPAGAWMILILMSLLAALTISGLLTLGGEEDLGPLRAYVSYRTGDAMGEVHEMLAWLLVVAIGGHLAGVFLETKIFGHPLLRAMTRGDMPLPSREHAPGWRAEEGPLALRGLLVLALALGLLAAGYGALSAKPDARWRQVQYIAPYEKNCGDCHHAHHPSLRSKAQWRRIMDGLEDHFGEDASVSRKDAAQILAFLQANDAFSFDTEAANRLGRAQGGDLRISSTPWWKMRHGGLPQSLFASPKVGSKANCNACHMDAASGRFDDAAITIPQTGKPPASAVRKGEHS